MPYDLDVSDADFRADPEYLFTRPATKIRITCTDQRVPDEIVINLPELRVTRDMCSPAWLILHDAEQREIEETK